MAASVALVEALKYTLWLTVSHYLNGSGHAQIQPDAPIEVARWGHVQDEVAQLHSSMPLS